MKKEPVLLMFAMQILDKLTPDRLAPLYALPCLIIMLFYDDTDQVIKKEKDRQQKHLDRAKSMLIL